MIVHGAIILDGDPSSFSIERADQWIAMAGGMVTARGRGDEWMRLTTSVPTASARAVQSQTRVIDAGGAYLAPAFVDLHCHGAGGFSAEDGQTGPAEPGLTDTGSAEPGLEDTGSAEPGLEEMLEVHRRHGTRALALSYVSDTVTGLCDSLTVGAQWARENPAVLGLHAEGPFLSPRFPGAHSPAVLTPPTAEAVAAIIAAADGTLAQITLAPELPGALDAIRTFTSAGVAVAIGHTSATYEQTARAFDAGASILTHTFNAMPRIHHREPGPILAAVDAGHVTLELINDGVHVSTPAARMITNLAPGRISLITDAMAATGMVDGQYTLGSLPVRVENSEARVLESDGSVGAIAGSTLTLDDAVRRAVAEVGMSPLEAVRAASLVPLRALGRIGEDEHCLLGIGMPAEYVLLDAEMNLLTSAGERNMAR